jgi:hypothetical protein
VKPVFLIGASFTLMTLSANVSGALAPAESVTAGERDGRKMVRNKARYVRG